MERETKEVNKIINSQDFRSWLWLHHRDEYTFLLFGKVEAITEEMLDEYEKQQKEREE